MKIFRYDESTNTIKLEPENFDDLYLLAIVVSKGDMVESRTSRRFRSSEKDIGEQKDVTVRISVDKIEVDKTAFRLRLTGKIVYGRPEEFVSMGSYHTLNIGPTETIHIQKAEWKAYVLRRLKQAVVDAKKPKLGIVVMDDEKAMIAYIKGYGVDIVSEIYSKLSKRMKEKEFAAQRDQYFDNLIKLINNMSVDIVVIAGPGFEKDDLKKYMQDKNIKVNKRLSYAAASDAERSGIREVMQSDIVAKIIENEHVKKEFDYLDMFLTGLRQGTAYYGNDSVNNQISENNVALVMVNDSVINQDEIKAVLDNAEKRRVRIEIFNSEDDAGVQLTSFKNIAALSKSLLK